jgi:hypothetical protein
LFFSGQAVLTPRLIRKNYGTFFVAVIRGDQAPERYVSPEEIGKICVRVLWPQVAFLAAISAAGYYFRGQLSEENIRLMNTISLWGRFLVVGPLSIQGAIRAHYSGFRLQAFRMQWENR